MVYWLRWIAVLPGALLAIIAANFILHMILYQTLTGSPGSEGLIRINPYPETPERLLLPFAAALAFVWGGGRIAPAHQMITASILFSLWMIYWGTIIALIVLKTDLGGGRHITLTYGSLSPVLAIIGASVGLYIIYTRKKRMKGVFQ